MTGHLLGAAGGIEAVFTVLAMRDQVAPPTTNLFNLDPQCDLDFVPLDRAQDEDPRARCRTRSASAAPTRRSRSARCDAPALAPSLATATSWH